MRILPKQNEYGNPRLLTNADLPTYILDTHAWFWFMEYPHLLSPAADAAFRLAAAGGAHIIVPAIVVAELYYLTVKRGDPISPAILIANINRSREFRFSALGQAQLTKMGEIDGVVEMHDRLILAEALAWQAPIITNDEVIRRCGVAAIIW